MTAQWRLAGHPPAVGGVDVPTFPIALVGIFLSRDRWDGPWIGLLTPAAFASAVKGEVFEAQRQGPRGGWYFAIKSGRAWSEWREKYVRICMARAVGEAKRRLDGTFKVHYLKRKGLR